MLRAVFALALGSLGLLLPVGPAGAQDASPRIVVSGGVGWSRFAGVGPLEEEGQTTTGFERNVSGFDFTLGGEVAIVDWLRAGVAHDRLASVQLTQSFEVDGFSGFTTELDRVFAPSVTELYAVPSWPRAGRVRLVGIVGVGFWRADETDTLALSFEGDELSRDELSREHSGTSLVIGAGVDVWLRRRLGVRLGYKYLRLSAGDLDGPVHNLRALALVGFGS